MYRHQIFDMKHLKNRLKLVAKLQRVNFQIPHIHDLMLVRRSWCWYYDGGSNKKLNLSKKVKILSISLSAKIRLTALKYVLRWDFKTTVLCGLLINSTILLSSHYSSNIIDDAPTSNLWSETCEILSRLCSFATNISGWGDIWTLKFVCYCQDLGLYII